MSRRPRTYDEMAQVLKVEVCRGLLPSGHYCFADHSIGEVQDSVIHWGYRAVALPGVYRFLKLVAISRDATINDDTPWRRVYRLNVAVRDISKEIHTRIPAKYSDYDRAFVRASIARLTNDERLRKQAFDWSRREGSR